MGRGRRKTHLNLQESEEFTKVLNVLEKPITSSLPLSSESFIAACYEKGHTHTHTHIHTHLGDFRCVIATILLESSHKCLKYNMEIFQDCFI